MHGPAMAQHYAYVELFGSATPLGTGRANFCALPHDGPHVEYRKGTRRTRGANDGWAFPRPKRLIVTVAIFWRHILVRSLEELSIV